MPAMHDHTMERRNGMLRFVISGFLALHGLVHMLYFGQSRGLFELQPGLTWPTQSWALSRVLSVEAIRALGRAVMILGAGLFLVAAAGLLVGQAWSRQLVVGAAALSSLAYIFLWDGGLHRLDQQGAVGVLINIAVLLVFVLWGGRLLQPGLGPVSSS
jgi:hypothetical protein